MHWPVVGHRQREDGQEDLHSTADGRNAQQQTDPLLVPTKLSQQPQHVVVGDRTSLKQDE